MKIKLMTLVLIFLPGMSFTAQTPGPPEGSEHHFPDCPSTPNCVSSLASDPARRIEPFPLLGSPERSMEKIAGIIRSMKRSTLVSVSGREVKAEFRSFLGFVDDVQFSLSPDDSVIHVRSAARTGTWDLGVNRRRVQRIRRRYLAVEY